MEKFLFTTLVGFFSWLMGGWSILLTTLFILQVVDFATGIAASWGSITSKIFYRGIIKKMLMWVWIAVGNLIYLILKEQGIDGVQIIPDAVAALFIFNELISFAENSDKLGIPIPEPVKKALALFESENEKENK